MVFKRRDPKSTLQSVGDIVYPRGGWRRALLYIRHRILRLKDTPHRISLGIGIGIFVSFSPFFGFHFLYATLLALMLRGNVIAALLATFFGNPLTFAFIATLSLRLGHLMLGGASQLGAEMTIQSAVASAFSEVWENLLALFGPSEANWTSLGDFFATVFLPYTVGGMLPGAVIGFSGYLASRPLIVAYQRRRKGRLLAKFHELRHKKQRKRRKSQGPEKR